MSDTGTPRRWTSATFTPLVLALVAGLVGGAVVVGLWELFRSDNGSKQSAAARTCHVEQIADDVLPSVVTLHVAGAEGQGTGSGVVVKAPIRGAGDTSSRTGIYIVSNEHVVSPGGQPGKVVVTFSDGETSPATVVGVDTVTDLAVVSADDLSAHARPVDVGSSADLRVGQQVVALGAPLGLSSTVTSGIVSATDRYVRVPSAAGSSHHLVGAIQTDAAINPGNSGGALVDCAGDLVGISSAGASPPGDQGSVGLNFAIPSTLFAPLATELIDSGRVRHPTLGLQVAALSGELAHRSPPGVLVQAVEEGGPAQRAGIRPGDLVVKVGDEAVRVPDDLTQLELAMDVGDTVQVTIERSGRRTSVPVTSVAAG